MYSQSHQVNGLAEVEAFSFAPRRWVEHARSVCCAVVDGGQCTRPSSIDLKIDGLDEAGEAVRVWAEIGIRIGIKYGPFFNRKLEPAKMADLRLLPTVL